MFVIELTPNGKFQVRKPCGQLVFIGKETKPLQVNYDEPMFFEYIEEHYIALTEFYGTNKAGVYKLIYCNTDFQDKSL